MNMKIAFFQPSTNLINAGLTINRGYKNAFRDMGFSFKNIYPDKKFRETFLNYKPDLFFFDLNHYHLKFLDKDLLLDLKRIIGTKYFVKIPFWSSPFSKYRKEETPSLKTDKTLLSLIVKKNIGDIYFTNCELDDERMSGFTKRTNRKYKTLLLAADKTAFFYDNCSNFKSDISYVGTYLPGKRGFFKSTIFPLKKNYDVKIYGQDWTTLDRMKRNIHKVGNYYNISLLKKAYKQKMQFSDERKIYSSSKISLNFHESYQRMYGDLNERTFKIPLSKGFQIVDNVSSLKKYFTPNKDIVVAENTDEWISKIEYYISHPEKRKRIIENSYINVLRNHTYHNRVKQILKWYEDIN